MCKLYKNDNILKHILTFMVKELYNPTKQRFNDKQMVTLWRKGEKYESFSKQEKMEFY